MIAPQQSSVTPRLADGLAASGGESCLARHNVRVLRKTRAFAVAVMIAVALAPTAAFAQSSDADMTRLPRVYASASIGLLGDDSDSRALPYSNPDDVSWLVEAGASITRRVGIGVELDRPTTVAGRTSTITIRGEGKQIERMVMALVRSRITASNRFAVDAVGGAGVLYQHLERRQSFCPVGIGPCVDSVSESLDRRSPTFVLGAETPIRLARYVFATPLLRVYFLRRGEHRNVGSAQVIPWQYEWASSTRLFVGAGVTIGW
jgi:hypothetical protein